MAPRKSKKTVTDEVESTTTNLHGLIEGHPLDAACALMRALNVVCGKDWKGISWTEVSPWGTKTTRHSTQVRVPTGVSTYEVVTWGRIVSGLYSGFLSQNIEHKRKHPILAISGQVDQESMPVVQKIIDRANQFVREASIFKGKALHLLGRESDYNQDGEPILDLFGTLPRFLDLSSVNEDQLRYPKDTMAVVRKALFTPVVNSMACRQAGVPLKRGIMLAGTYGVGKTLCAFVTAKKAVANGWTYIYVDDVNNLERGVDFALAYQPAILYAEDVDQIKGIHERDNKGNRIVNALDSIESKNSEILIVLTTNHLEMITPALLRPGRIDAIINIPVPDAETREGLIRMYAGKYLIHDADLWNVSQMLAGQIPAVIRETVERAKLARIADCPTDEDAWVFTPLDLMREAKDMVAHAKQVQTIKEPQKLSKREKAAALYAEVVVKQSNDLGRLMDQFAELKN